MSYLELSEVSSEAAVADQRVVLERGGFRQICKGEVLDLSERLVPRRYECIILVEVDGARKRSHKCSDGSGSGANLRRGLETQEEKSTRRLLVRQIGRKFEPEESGLA